jgi:hypothetical protein
MPPPSAAVTVAFGEHWRSKASTLLAGNARVAQRVIRASETVAADEDQRWFMAATSLGCDSGWAVGLGG